MLRMLVVCVATSVVMAVAASGAAVATSFELEPGGEIVLASSGAVTFQMGLMSVSCNVTMSGSLSTGPIELVDGEQVGAITAATAAACANGSISFAPAGGWRYEQHATLGSVPDGVTGVLWNVTQYEFTARTLGGLVICIYKGTIGVLKTATNRSRSPWKYSLDDPTHLGGATTLPLQAGSNRACAATASITGSYASLPQRIVFP